MKRIFRCISAVALAFAVATQGTAVLVSAGESEQSEPFLRAHTFEADDAYTTLFENKSIKTNQKNISIWVQSGNSYSIVEGLDGGNALKLTQTGLNTVVGMGYTRQQDENPDEQTTAEKTMEGTGKTVTRFRFAVTTDSELNIGLASMRKSDKAHLNDLEMVRFKPDGTICYLNQSNNYIDVEGVQWSKDTMYTMVFAWDDVAKTYTSGLILPDGEYITIASNQGIQGKSWFYQSDPIARFIYRLKPADTTSEVENTMLVDDIYTYETMAYCGGSITDGVFAGDKNAIEVKFTDVLNKDSISNLKLVGENNTEYDYTYTLSPDGSSVIISCPWLVYGKDYKLLLSGVRGVTAGAVEDVTEVPFTAVNPIMSDIRFYDNTDVEIESTPEASNTTVVRAKSVPSNSAVTAKATVRNNTKNPVNLTLVSVLNNGGKVEAVNLRSIDAPAEMDSDATITVPITTGTVSSDTKLSAYLIYDLSDENTHQDNGIAVEVTDAVKQTLSITGIAEHGQQGQSIDVIILNPGKAITGITAGSQTSASEAIQYIGRDVTGTDGQYQFDLAVNEKTIESTAEDSNTYIIYVFGDNINGIKSRDFLYYGNAVKDGIVEKVNRVHSLSEFKSELNTQEYFTILLGNDFPLVNAIADKDDIISTLISLKSGKTIADSAELVQLTKESIVLTALNNKNSEVFGDEVDSAKYMSALYASTMGISDTTVFDTYKNDVSADGVKAVNESVSGKNITTVKDFQDKFMEQTIINAFANPKQLGYNHIKGIVEKNRKYLENNGFKVSTYLGLSKTTTADKAIFEGVSKGVSTIGALRTLFNNSLKDNGDQDQNQNKEKNSVEPSTLKKTTPVAPGGSTFTPVTNPNDNKDAEPGSKIAFTDLGSVPWAVESINALVDKGVISGMSDTQFAPQSNVTREQFVKMLVLALGLDISGNTDISFTDVPADAWSRAYIECAYRNGIVNGKSDTVFGASDEVTREDIAVMVVRGIKAIGANPQLVQRPEFADSDAISDYAKEGVNTIKDMGIMTGRDDNIFAPKDSITRAEAAKTLHNFMLVR